MKAVFKNIYTNIPFKKNALILIRSVVDLKPQTYQHLSFKGVINVEIDQSHSFKMMHYGHYIENEMFWSGFYGGWEKESLKIWSKLCVFSQTIFDIGANTGIYSLAAKSLSPNSKVYALEPVVRVYEKLSHNCKLNGFDVCCINSAASDTDGTAVIYDPMTDHLYSVTVNKNIAGEDVKVEEVEIQASRIDTVIEKHDIHGIDLMKIDVESHEVEVLVGMGTYLEKFLPTMIIEILDNKIGDGVSKVLSGLGYLYFYIDEESGPQRVSELQNRENNNYLVCRKEVAKKLGIQF